MKKYTHRNYHCNKCTNIDKYEYCKRLRREYHQANQASWECICLSRELKDPYDCPLALYFRKEKGLIDDLPRPTPIVYILDLEK